MKVRFSMFLLVGIGMFCVGCGGNPVVEESAPPPTQAEIEENEAMGAVPNE